MPGYSKWILVPIALLTLAIATLILTTGESSGSALDVCTGDCSNELSGGNLFVGSDFIHLWGDFENVSDQTITVTSIDFLETKGLGTVIEVPELHIAPRWLPYWRDEDRGSSNFQMLGTHHLYPMSQASGPGGSCARQEWVDVQGFSLEPGQWATLATRIQPLSVGQFELKNIRINYLMGGRQFHQEINHSRGGEIAPTPDRPPHVTPLERRCLDQDSSVNPLEGWRR